MKIIVAKNAGFCYGVKRALDITYKTLKRGQNPLYMLGEIVHNEEVVDKIKKTGIKIIDNLDKVKKGTIIIRAHGATPEVFQKAKDKGLEIIDATCPMVSRIHQLARNALSQNYQIIIVGDKGHDEILGILGAINQKAIVVENAKEAEKLKNFKKVALFSQTTQSLSNFKEVAEILSENCPELRIFNTICLATKLHQAEVEKIAKEVDKMIIIGSKTSANTKRLVQISEKIGTPTYLISEANQLKKEWFKNFFGSDCCFPWWFVLWEKPILWCFNPEVLKTSPFPKLLRGP